MLECFYEFRFYPPTSRISCIVLRFIYTCLSHYPQLAPSICKYICTLARSWPEYIPSIVELISSYDYDDVDGGGGGGGDGDLQPEGEKLWSHSVSIYLLTSLEQIVYKVPLEMLANYLDLLLHLAGKREICPLSSISVLQDYVENVEICESKRWSIGTRILDIVVKMILTHETKKIMKRIATLLNFLHHNFDDPNVRDRSYLYSQLVSHRHIYFLLACFLYYTSLLLFVSDTHSFFNDPILVLCMVLYS